MPLSQSYEIVGGFPIIDIGKLRHLVTIQKQGPASPPNFDAAGPKSVWNPFTTAMAAIDIVSGTEVIRGGLTVTELYLIVTMYYQPGITPDMRVASDNGSTYLIRSVANVMEMNAVLELNCLGLQENV